MSDKLYVSIAGVPRSAGRSVTDYRVFENSLKISDVIDDAPNRAFFQAVGFMPSVGDRVIMALGSIANDRLFAGNILTVDQGYLAGEPDNQCFDVSCVDDTTRLNRRKVIGYFTGTADEIAIELVTRYASWVTVNHVVAGLPTVSGGITFTNQDLTDCLTSLAKSIGGYWYLDYTGDLHFFLEEFAGSPSDNPVELTNAHSTLRNVRIKYDISQVVTRVFVEGGGGTALAEIAAGETILPVSESSWYNVAGGTVVSGPQRFDYAGLDSGGGGGLVGTGYTPTTAPTLGFAAGSGVTSGLHEVSLVFETGSGLTRASALASITVGDVPAPTSTPTAATPTSGGSITAGAHYYAYTEDTPSGETTPSPVSNTVTALAEESAPASAPVQFAGGTTRPGAALDPGALYGYAFTFWDGGSRETTLSPVATSTLNNFASNVAGAIQVSSLPSPPSGFQLRFYRTEGGGSTYKLLPYGQAQGQFSEVSAGYYIDVKSDADLGTVAPTANTTKRATVVVSGIPLPSAFATARYLYRTEAGGSQLKRVGTITAGATNYTDTLADGSLGANAPSSAPTANQIAVSTIQLGPTGVTARRLYMSAAGGGGTRRLALTISNNTDTTGTITMSDATLAGQSAEPGTDTSGLSQPDGEVLAGATSIPVAGLAGFPSEGWAIVGNGAQVVRYTGKSSTALTGVTGITSVITYNSSITAAPQLTGITSGSPSDGSITYTIPKGQDVNLLVQVEDVDAQTVMGLIVRDDNDDPTDGVIEEYLQDRRLSEGEARARGQAYLDLHSEVETAISYQVRNDFMTKSGRTIDVDLTTPMTLSGSFKIQTVDISMMANDAGEVEVFFDAMASTKRFSFEDLLRQARSRI